MSTIRAGGAGSRQGHLFESARLQMTQSIELTIQSLQTYGERHEHWAIAWSGGKDSTALVTLVVYLIAAGKVPAPKTLTVLYADTRMELLPLSAAALDIQEELRERGIEVRTVMAPMDKRFFVYMLGRGVPPPNNNTFRWCTRQIKIEPMAAELRRLHGDRGGKILMLTGVRQGESAIRDGRIAMSCGRDGAECGQGWYQETLPGALCDTLAPLLHWRVCHVWEWLKHWAPTEAFGDWSTADIADAYGGDEAEEINARTGCVGCPLANRDTALDAVLRSPRWQQGPHPLLVGHERAIGACLAAALAQPVPRLAQLPIQRSRLYALGVVLGIQAEINQAAADLGRPALDLLNAEEEARIRELIAVGTWPQKWDGSEPTGDEEYDAILPGGAMQPLLWRAG